VTGFGLRTPGFGHVTRAGLFLAAVVLTPAAAPAQTTAKPPVEVAVSPIECWWKTDRSAIRVGEQFQLTLTCAVLDTDKVKVVVDESSLAPSALHLVPFEIVSGQRFRDIRNSPRRFFQYQYVMRVLGEDFFDKEVSLPRLQITYRVQNMLNSGPAIAGREAQYSLRPVPIRVLSLVPNAAADIRDTPPETFGDVDTRLFQSNILLIGAGVGLALALLLLVVVTVRTTVKHRAASAVKKRAVSPTLVLRAASRELAAVKSAAQSDGWNGELAGRAAAALRLAGAIALRRPVSQREALRGAAPSEGQIAIRHGLRGRKIVLSSAVTSDALNGPAANAIWSGISQTLGVFTAVRYSKNGTPDATALDTALAEGQDLVRRLRRNVLLRLTRSRSNIPEPAKPTWAR
jgi:hypothetical protein